MENTISFGQFASKMEAYFDPSLQNTFHKDLKFKELEEWNSMQALIIIAFIDEVYGVTIDAKDLKESETLDALFMKADKALYRAKLDGRARIVFAPDEMAA